MPQIALVEFLYGFSFGVFFFFSENINKINIFKVFICSLLNTIILIMVLTNNTNYVLGFVDVASINLVGIYILPVIISICLLLS